eukprot:scaffold7328_cov314-Pinguiococcus_pyrenoidosus.AAC.13
MAPPGRAEGSRGAFTGADKFRAGVMSQLTQIELGVSVRFSVRKGDFRALLWPPPIHHGPESRADFGVFRVLHASGGLSSPAGHNQAALERGGQLRHGGSGGAGVPPEAGERLGRRR